MKIDIRDWKDFRFGTLISQIYKAKAHTDDELEFSDFPTKETIPYVTRTDLNNGVKAFVYRKGINSIEKGNALVIGDTTATVSYQQKEFVTGDHIVIVRAPWLNMFTGLFIVSILKLEQYRYSYGRAFTMDLVLNTYVKLPAQIDGKPDWKFIEKFMGGLHTNPITTSNKPSHKPLETKNWNKFRIGSIFKLRNGKGNETLLEDGTSCFYLGAKKSDNGIMRRCAYNPDLVQPGNCIIFICNGQGSVGYANYMDEQFIGTTDVVAGYNNHLNPLNGLFIATVASLERPKYSWGRKWKTHLADTCIKLPSTSDGAPDWNFMVRYIKSLPYGDRISSHC